MSVLLDDESVLAVEVATDNKLPDLAFVLNATSSMWPYIDNVKTSIRAVIVRQTHRSLNLRLAAVVYHA
jgi:hypothetical protein